MFLFKVIFSDKVSVHTNNLDDIGGRHWRGVSVIDLASHSKVHAAGSRDRLWNTKDGVAAGNYKPRLCGKPGFVWKQLSVLGRFWKSWAFIPSSMFDHFLHTDG